MASDPHVSAPQVAQKLSRYRHFDNRPARCFIHARRQARELAAETAEVNEEPRGLSHRQANALFVEFCREASMSGDRVTGASMKVGV